MAKRNAVISKLKNRQGQHEYQPPEGAPEETPLEGREEELAPPEVVPAEEPQASAPAAPKRQRSSASGKKAVGAASRSRATAASVAAPELEVVGGSGDGVVLPRPVEEVPGVERFGDDLMLRDERGKLRALDEYAKLTFGMTALEQHRFKEYARRRGKEYTDIFREFCGQILSGEVE